MTGRSLRVSASMIPLRVAISISPVHRDITPSMVMQSSTASLAESRAPFVTSAMCPVSAPYITPIIIRTAHM